MTNILHVNEASRLTGRSPNTIRSYIRDFPDIKAAPGKVYLDALQAVIAKKAAGDLRTVTTLRGLGVKSSQQISDSDLRGVADLLAATRLQKEQAALEKVQIANARAAGDLVRMSDAEAILTRLVIAARQRLESIPGKVAPQIEGRNRREIESLLTLEIEAALRELSQGMTRRDDASTIAEAFA